MAWPRTNERVEDFTFDLFCEVLGAVADDHVRWIAVWDDLGELDAIFVYCCLLSASSLSLDLL